MRSRIHDMITPPVSGGIKHDLKRHGTQLLRGQLQDFQTITFHITQKYQRIVQLFDDHHAPVVQFMQRRLSCRHRGTFGFTRPQCKKHPGVLIFRGLRHLASIIFAAKFVLAFPVLRLGSS